MKPIRAAKKSPSTAGQFRLDVDLETAEREAHRVRAWLAALRKRHDLSRFEYTKHVRVVPASKTYSHPILTLGTRFTETEDHLLATYLHEQMHWYLYHLGGPDHDPIAPFFDELVRRYPDAPTQLPEGARNYEQTYAHLVINFLELHATSEIIGKKRAVALAETHYGYRWIYRMVVRDWDSLAQLYKEHGILPVQPASKLLKGKPVEPAVAAMRKSSKLALKLAKPRAVKKKTSAAAKPPRSRKSRRRPPARGGRSAAKKA